MRPNGFRVAAVMIIGGAMVAAAQTVTPITDLTGLCGLRYKVAAGAGTGLYDPARNRDGARVLTWDQLENIRYGRTIRTTKDLPSVSSPERRVGAEATLYAIEGQLLCETWGGREAPVGTVGSAFMRLFEDGPKSKGRSIDISIPSTTCTYGSPNFQRLKDFTREIEPYINFSPGSHRGGPCTVAPINRHVKVFGYGFWTDSGAQKTSKDKGVALTLAPVVDIIVMDQPGGVEVPPPYTPDPKEAFVANWAVTARSRGGSVTNRGSQRDGIWVYDAFSAGIVGSAVIPGGFDLANSGNNELLKGIGDFFSMSADAPFGKVLTTAGYSFDANTPSDRKPSFGAFAGTNRISKPSFQPLWCGDSPKRTSFSIGHQKWDCFDRGNGQQTLHLVNLTVSFSEQCKTGEVFGWQNVSGSLTFTAPEQVPCAFATSAGGTIDSGDDSGDDGSVDDGSCPAGFDPATDCPDPAPPEDPGPPPEDPPMIGLPGSVTTNSLVMTSGQSKTMRFTVVTMGDADVDLAATSDSEFVSAGLSRTSIPLPGTGTANLTISVRDDAPVGDYTVTVSATNVGLTATAPVHIAIRCDPPTILGIDQPRGTVVDRGATATLEVKPGGSGPFTYQWYEGVTGMTFNPIAGATGKTFTTPAINQTTDYWVRVTNACGSVDSNAAEVTVKF